MRNLFIVISSTLLILTVNLFGASSDSPSPAVVKDLKAYNVVWTNQSKNSSESMPLSGGILGLNVWVENGDVCFLMGSPDCMDANGMQVKLGLVRVHIEPAAFDAGFRQELCLEQSEIIISGKTTSGEPVTVKLWCGVDKPVVHVEISAGVSVNAKVTYETWSGYDVKMVGKSLQWGRRLEEVNSRRQNNMKAQGMAEFDSAIPDPLSGLTMGGSITASGMVDAGTGTGKFNNMNTKTGTIKTAAPVKKLDLCIALRMEQDKSLTLWEAQLAKDMERAVKSAKADRAAALKWWSEFWGRSWIVINPEESQSVDLKSEILNVKSSPGRPVAIISFPVTCWQLTGPAGR